MRTIMYVQHSISVLFLGLAIVASAFKHFDAATYWMLVSIAFYLRAVLPPGAR